MAIKKDNTPVAAEACQCLETCSDCHCQQVRKLAENPDHIEIIRAALERYAEKVNRGRL